MTLFHVLLTNFLFCFGVLVTLATIGISNGFIDFSVGLAAAALSSYMILYRNKRDA